METKRRRRTHLRNPWLEKRIGHEDEIRDVIGYGEFEAMMRENIDWRKEPLGVALKKDNAIVQYPSSIPGEHVYFANTVGTVEREHSSATNRFIASKDHASVEISVRRLYESARRPVLYFCSLWFCASSGQSSSVSHKKDAEEISFLMKTRLRRIWKLHVLLNKRAKISDILLFVFLFEEFKRPATDRSLGKQTWWYRVESDPLTRADAGAYR
ncbi:40S ribosomal protein S21-2-like protein [Tanacetum coccineum]